MSDTPLADQVHVAYRLPSPQDAAALRLAALRESVIPKALWDELAFFGHRQSLNVVALTPAANAFAELSPDFCLWLAQRLGAHVPMHLNEEPVTAALSSRPYDYSLHSFVLSRSGTDWKKAQEPERVIAALARRLHSDLTTFANAWVYPSQSDGWHMVSLDKLGSWFLLMMISVVLVSLVHRPEEEVASG